MSQIIYGRNTVLEWLNSGLKIERLLLTNELQGEPAKKIRELAAEKNIQIKHITKVQLDNLTYNGNHQGAAASVEMPPYATLDDILNVAKKRKEPSLIAILDSVQDPQNLGAIIRSADGAGVHGIIIPKDNAVELTPTAFKASAGAAAYMPVAKVTNLARTIDDLKKDGFWVTGVDQDGDKDYTTADYQGNTVLVLGSEGKGIRRLVKEKCDFLVSIPMHGQVNSLNVSVAAALVFFQARKQKTEKNR